MTMEVSVYHRGRQLQAAQLHFSATEHLHLSTQLRNKGFSIFSTGNGKGEVTLVRPAYGGRTSPEAFASPTNPEVLVLSLWFTGSWRLWEICKILLRRLEKMEIKAKIASSAKPMTDLLTCSRRQGHAGGRDGFGQKSLKCRNNQDQFTTKVGKEIYQVLYFFIV